MQRHVLVESLRGHAGKRAEIALLYSRRSLMTLAMKTHQQLVAIHVGTVRTLTHFLSFTLLAEKAQKSRLGLQKLLHLDTERLIVRMSQFRFSNVGTRLAFPEKLNLYILNRAFSLRAKFKRHLLAIFAILVQLQFLLRKFGRVRIGAALIVHRFLFDQYWWSRRWTVTSSWCSLGPDNWRSFTDSIFQTSLSTCQWNKTLKPVLGIDKRHGFRQKISKTYHSLYIHLRMNENVLLDHLALTAIERAF